MVDSTRPDPSCEQLRPHFGDLVSRLGEVRIRRRILPEVGMLYATTKGIYFLPHRIEEIIQLTEERASPSLLWTVAALVWSPLSLLLPLLRPKQLREVPTQVYRPQLLSAAESELLPELLMDNPGAFFLPARSVRLIVRRGDRWIVERVQGAKVVLRPENDGLRFHERMQEFLGSPEWQPMAFGW